MAGGNGGRDYIFLPESEARYVRLALERGPADTFALVRSSSSRWSGQPRRTRSSSRGQGPVPGSYPKYLSNVQSYWTIAGVDGDQAEVLVNEEGMVEARKGGFSVEPFVFIEGKLVTWREAKTTQTLDGGHFPEPSVSWDGGDWSLTLAPVTVLGPRDSSTVYLQYRIANRSRQRRTVQLYLAVRPFQVNPSWQFLNTPGGAATVRELSFENQTVQVNGEVAVVSLTPSTGFGAATFDQGNIVDYLRAGRLPTTPNVRDTFGHASGALAYTANLDSGTVSVVEVALPLHPASVSSVERERLLGARAPRDRVADARRIWRDALERVTIELPPSASRVVNSLYANLGYVLVNRDHAGLQPGSRSYERSWIRDGSLSLRRCCAWAARTWRASSSSGSRISVRERKVPCCVDSRGADPVPETRQPRGVHLPRRPSTTGTRATAR